MNEADVFKEEARELLEEVETTILALSEAPSDLELLNKLFRDLHTIKGSGSMFGFPKVAAFAHKLEDTIDSIRKEKSPFSAELVDPFLAGRDYITEMIEAAGSDLEEIGRGGDILQKIEIIMGRASEAAEPSAGKTPDNLRILIVEDEFCSRLIIQDFLAVYGSTHIAVDGYEAISAIKTAITEKIPYDLICLDIKMPGIDGKKVSEEIKRLEKEAGSEAPCKIVMTSVIDNQQTIDELIKKKYCDLYLTKPVSIHKLAKFIQQSFTHLPTIYSQPDSI